MFNTLKSKWYAAVAAVAFSMLPLSGHADESNRLVILHTNDTHSIIQPYYENNLGGVARRKALIDSVRAVEPNVLLVDAGDVLQGSLYFTLFEGAVEQKVMNDLDYDIQILGNHEFDKGMAGLERYVKDLNADLLATNYDLSKTALKKYFKPYTTRTVGGKRLGFIGINIDPHGLIDSLNSVGVVYRDALKAANAMGWYLKNIDSCDIVVAVTHIGYDEKDKMSDSFLAKNTENIDVIIGGHSHTLIDPNDPNGLQSKFVNLAGDTVLVAQTGKYGAYLGEVVIDLDNGQPTSRVIKVDKRLDNRLDSTLIDMLQTYKHPVDSICAIKVGTATGDFPRKPELMNWMADFVYKDAKRLTDRKIDMSIVNSGGIRSPFLAGDITKGMIMQSFPFDNYEVVLEISGKHLVATLDSLAAHGGNGVSRNVKAVIDPAAKKCVSVTIDGKPIDPDRTYYVATINYLAGGNDGMEPLKYGKIVGKSKKYIYDDMINAFEKGFLKRKKQKPDPTVRMTVAGD